MQTRQVKIMLRVGVGVVIGAVIVGGMAAMHTAEGQAGPLNPLGVEVVGPREWLCDSTAALRVIVTDHRQGEPVRGARVTIALRPRDNGRYNTLHTGRTDRRGTLDASFTVPDLPPGAYDLRVSAAWRNLRDETSQTITLKRAGQILLTSDKPIYQPGQVMHLRAMALRRPGLTADANQDLTLEVSDSKGNKVFRRTSRTNDFGIAAADFQLADEVNMGRYTLRALLGGEEAEKTVTVSRYVLPKFKVGVSTDRGYYLPGERVEGKVQADYFFGKPISGGEVVVSVKTFDVDFTEIQRIEGQTDETGTFKFECTLPRHFVGQPLEQGKAFLQFDVKVTDQAEHSEEAIHTSSVAASRLVVNAVPEAGRLIPGVENIIYVLTSLPTGEPVEATVRVEGMTLDAKGVELERSDFRTDELGLAEVTVVVPQVEAQPARGGVMQRRMAPRPFDMEREAEPRANIALAARTPDGTIVRKEIALSTEAGLTESLLLRVDKPLLRVGDTVTATAVCSADAGSVYFDVVKDRQTMLTHAADIQGGRAEASIRLGHDLAGTIYLTAYRINPSGQIVRDTRPLFVQAADDLRISIEADRETYLPGSEATLTFAVADEDGRPVASALGVNVVDESVFALQELQPGMEKVFFYLEQELMTPRYEIHGFELPTIITKRPEAEPAEWRDSAARAARVVFASVQAPELNLFQVNTYAERISAAKDEWAERMSGAVQRVQDAIRAYRREHRELPPVEDGIRVLARQGFLRLADLTDLWGNAMILKPLSFDERSMYAAIVISPGPDGKPGTVDDIIMSSETPGRWFEDEEQARRPMLQEAILFAAPEGAMPGMGPGPVRALAADAMVHEAKAAPPAATPEEREAVRVREHFPETMFTEPSLITDEQGRATLTIPMADSITTWRLAAMANSRVGQLGSTTTGIRCFQDFFVDIDLPVSLTQNDQVSIPIAVYNYLPGKQTVRLELTRDDWFELKGEAVQSLEIGPNDVDVRYFTLRVTEHGDHPLTVHAFGSQMSDAIKRSIEVVPDGRRVETTTGGRLSGTVEESVSFPRDAVEGASNIFVKIYPGVFSQVVEGLDSILQMPFGCFEQTVSVAWPNVLVMDYMKTTRQITPEIQMKAEGFINLGYQRMVSYEVSGGGFSWFGQPPANRVLTAWGLMAFHDMAAVHNVDPAIISRTQQWLLDQADKRGAYQPDENFLHAESWSKIQVDELLPTAYILWALTHSECRDAGVRRSADFVREHWRKAAEPYSLAIVANGLVGADIAAGNHDLGGATREALEALIKLARTDGDQMWWEAGISGITSSTGKSADLEATGMAALALIRSGMYGAEAARVLNYLVATKDPRGTWFSTNATTLALRALTLAQKGAATRVDGEVTITVNGRQAGAFALTPEDADVMRVVDCREFVRAGENDVRVHFAGEGSTLYQIVGRHYEPWKLIERPDVEPLSIDLRYDKTTLAKDDTVTATVTVRNNTPLATSMIIVDLGIPPGFSVDADAFAELVEAEKIDRFTITGRQVIVYLERMEPREELTFSYTLRARFPLRAQTPKSTVYEYYNPENRADSKPVEMEVTEG